MSIYISNLAYEIGQSFNIEKLNEIVPDKALLKYFSKAGLEQYLQSNASIFDLAEKSAAKTIESYSKEEIDAFIFATSSFYPSKQTYRRTEMLKDLNSILTSLEIDAYPYGVFLSDCANIISAFKIGSALLSDDSNFRKIIIVTSDAVGEQELRIVPPGISVKSDGAASCILSKERIADSIEILAIYQVHNKNMVKKNYELSYQEQSNEFRWCINKIIQEFINKFDFDYKWVITNNYSRMYAKSLSYILKIQSNNFFTKLIPKYAHCFSADILLNLFELTRMGNLASGDKLLVISSSPSSMGAMILGI